LYLQVWGLGFGVWGLGFGVWGLGFWGITEMQGFGGMLVTSDSVYHDEKEGVVFRV
jgi:hypothetical protein